MSKRDIPSAVTLWVDVDGNVETEMSFGDDEPVLYLTESRVKKLIKEHQAIISDLKAENERLEQQSNEDDVIRKNLREKLQIATEALENIGNRKEPLSFDEAETYGYLTACEDVIRNCKKALQKIKEKK